MIKSVCVYCASSSRIDQKYFDVTKRLGEEFAAHDIQVVYGGGAVGLMGQLADTVLENGGKVKGIIPNFMKEVEWGHPNVTDMIYTDTMHERKAKLLENVDAIIALPGGTGTLEELLEAFTLKKLGKLTIPIIVLDTDDYYRGLREMIANSIKENFMSPVHNKIWQFVSHPEEVLSAIENAPAWTESAIDFAVVK